MQLSNKERLISGKALLSALLCLPTPAGAASLSVEMKELQSGETAGYVSIEENHYGVVFTPNLSGLPTYLHGLHGFHVHENPSCAAAQKNGKLVAGGGAGGHYDPMKTGKHGLPWSDDSHLGDLPPLYIDRQGKASQALLSPKIRLADLTGRALIVHAGGDNHSDQPKALGGGGARVLCGVIRAPAQP